jgi:hypothetical protein
LLISGFFVLYSAISTHACISLLPLSAPIRNHYQDDNVVVVVVTIFMMKVVKEGQALDFCTKPSCQNVIPLQGESRSDTTAP